MEEYPKDDSDERELAALIVANKAAASYEKDLNDNYEQELKTIVDETVASFEKKAAASYKKDLNDNYEQELKTIVDETVASFEKDPKDDSDQELSLQMIIDRALASYHENKSTCEPNDPWNASSTAAVGLRADSIHSYGENQPWGSASTLAFTNNPVGSNQIDSSVTTSTEDRTSVGMHSSTFSDANASETWGGVMKPTSMFPNDGQRHATSHWGQASGPKFRPIVQRRQPAPQSTSSQSYGNMNLHSYEPVQKHSTSQRGQIRGLHCSSVVQWGQPVPQSTSQSYGNMNLHSYEPVQQHSTSQRGRIRGLHCSSVVQWGQPVPQSTSQSYGNMNLHSYEPVQQHSTSQRGRIRGLHCSSVVQWGEPVPQFMSAQSYGNPILYPHEPVQHRPQQTIPYSTPQQNFHNWRLNPIGESIHSDYSNTTQPSWPSVSQPNSSRSNTSDELRQPQNEQESLRTSSLGNPSFSEVHESSVSIINSGDQPNTNITCGFACSKCGKEFTSEQPLKKHQYYAHDPQRPFDCNICEKRIIGTTKFKLHKMLHKRMLSKRDPV